MRGAYFPQNLFIRGRSQTQETTFSKEREDEVERVCGIVLPRVLEGGGIGAAYARGLMPIARITSGTRCMVLV